MNQTRCFRPTLLLAAASIFASASAIDFGQVDDFQDGTIMNWSGGFQNLSNQDGGPLGMGDRYLEVFSTGGAGPGSKLACKNELQWVGNYEAAGVTVVELDIRNLGQTNLEMRAVLFGPFGTRWTSINAVPLAANGPWRRIAFSLKQDALTRVIGGETYQETITACSRIMLRHDPGTPSSGGESVVATVGFDNITATDHATLLPETMSFVRGILISGTINDLFHSDDMRLVARPGIVFSTAEAPLQLQLQSTNTFVNPTELRFRLEAHTNQGNLNQKILLFNYTSNAYEELDSRMATTSDSVVEVVVTSNPTRFINASGQVRALVTYKAAGPVFSYPWLARIDQAVWKIYP